MSQQSLLSPDPSENLTKFSSLGDLVGYFKHLSDNKILNGPMDGFFGGSTLLNAHLNKSALFFDKYFDCSIPDVQLEFLFESMGISSYEAYLHSDKKFKHFICECENHFSELFVPNVVGDRWNPFVRFKSSNVCGSQQCSKLLDLAGLDTVDLFGDSSAGVHRAHENVFNSLVLTFPDELSSKLMDPQFRSRALYRESKRGLRSSQLDIKPFHLIDRMNRCVSVFFHRLHEVFALDPQFVLGMSCSFHPWSSAFPFLPHAHFHVILPHFCYRNVGNEFRSLYADILLEPLTGLFDGVVVAVESPVQKSTSQVYGSMGCKVTHTAEVSAVSKFIVDRERYTSLRLELSDKLGELLRFTPIDWYGSTPRTQPNGIVDLVESPLDVDVIRRLWSDIVYSEFADLLCDDRVLLDVHTQFIPASNKSKLLHALQYKTRPPVLDLDLFFKRCPSFVTGYSELNPEAALSYVSSLLTRAVNNGDMYLVQKYTSLMFKAEKLFAKHSSADVYRWLQFLSTWSTDTRVFGFWRSIKRYLLDPDHRFLVVEHVCPVCDGFVTLVRYVSSVAFDSVIVRTGSKFLVYDVKGPPYARAKKDLPKKEVKCE
jgi:hypothetical protein